MKNILLSTIINLLLISFAFAQTGPAGVGNSSNNILWLNANSVSGINNSPIATWNDISGNGNNASQSTSNRQALLKTGQLNNQNVIEFDGVNDFYNLSHITSSGASIFIVFNTDGIGKRPLLVTNKHLSWGRNINGYATYDGNTRAVSKGAYPSIFSLISNSSATSNYKLTADNNASSFSKSTFNNIVRSSIGCYFTSTSRIYKSHFFQGQIAEIIMYNERLNTARQNIVYSSLSAKYDRPAPANLYTFKTVYNHDVKGIGQEADGNHTSARGRDSLLINNPSNLDNGEYLMVGHNNNGYGVSTQVPAGVTDRWNQVWRVDKTGNPGTIDVEFFLGVNGFASVNRYAIIIETDDGDFTNGGTSIHTTGRNYDAFNNSISFTDLDLADSAYFTLAEVDAAITSVQDGDWNTTSTWDCECIPSLEDIVIAQDSVTISSNQSVLSLTLNNGGQLVFSGSDTLFVYGEFKNEGSFNPGSGTIAAMQQNDPQYFKNLSATPFPFYNLYVNNQDGLVLDSGAWMLSNNLQVSSGGMDVSLADSIVLLSTASKTAQILKSINGAFSGEFILERYIGSRNANYANMSSPIENATAADLDDDLFLSGINGNNGNINTGSGIFRSMFFFDIVADTHQAITSTSTILPPTKGYEVYLATTSSTFNATTIDYHGTPNTGFFYLTVNQGWNLTGNPYYSHIEFDSLVNRSWVKDEFYIFNTDNGTYDLYSGGSKPLIAPGQGFWFVKELPGSSSNGIFFREEAKVSSTSSTFYRKKELNSDVHFEISNNKNDFKHKMKVQFNAFSTAELDQNDSWFLSSPIKEAPAIYSIAENSNKELVVNSLNPTEESQLIPISVYAGVEGQYEINTKNIDALYDNYSCVYLKDKETEEAIDLMVEPNYTFEAKEGKVDRFHLILSNNYIQCQEMIENGEFNQKLDTKVSLRNAYEQWYLDYTLGEAQTQLEVRIYNMSGQEVKAPQSFEANGAGTYPLQNLNDLDGIYLIQVIGKDVFLNKQVKL